MKLQLNRNQKPKRRIRIHHRTSSRSSSSIEPDVVQQFIAEMGFSCLDHNNANVHEKQLKRKKQQELPCFERIAAPSPTGFGLRINRHNFGDASFHQVTDRNGLSWWYDTSEDSDESLDI